MVAPVQAILSSAASHLVCQTLCPEAAQRGEDLAVGEETRMEEVETGYAAVEEVEADDQNCCFAKAVEVEGCTAGFDCPWLEDWKPCLKGSAHRQYALSIPQALPRIPPRPFKR